MNTTPPPTTRQAGPTSFDLAIPGTGRGEFRIFRFNRSTRTLSFVRTMSSADALTSMRHFIPYAGGTIHLSVGGIKDDVISIAPTAPPPSPTPPLPGGDGYLVLAEEMALVGKLLAQHEHVTVGTVLVNTAIP